MTKKIEPIKELDINMQTMRDLSNSFGEPLHTILIGIGDMALKLNQVIEAINQLNEKGGKNG